MPKETDLENQGLLPDDSGHNNTIEETQIDKKTTEHWESLRKFTKAHDDAMCNAWREEIEKLLIFASLFSATITAFIIDSYKWLQPESDDITAQYLGFLTAQFAQMQNVTLPDALTRLDAAPEVTSSVVRINILWFLSLILSLSAVLIGILCYQWLREFQAEAPNLTHRGAVGLRQIKFHGLNTWHVPAIISTVPLLLQVALLLFFAGILDLLWDRNRVVAAVITVAVGTIVLFLFITTVAPALQYLWSCYAHRIIRSSPVAQSPFKSTQSWILVRLILMVQKFSLKKQTHDQSKPGLNLGNWTTYDLHWQGRSFMPGALYKSEEDMSIPLVIEWMHNNWTQDANAIRLIDKCLADIPLRDAKEFVKKCYGNRSEDIKSFEDQVGDSGIISQPRNTISNHYLSFHLKQFPVLMQPWAEAVLQNFRVGFVPSPFLHLILKDMCSPPCKYEPAAIIKAIESLSIHCLHYQDYQVDKDDIYYAWRILRTFCWGEEWFYGRSKALPLEQLNKDRLTYAGDAAKSFRHILQGKNDPAMFMSCAEGIAIFWHPKEGAESFRTFKGFSELVDLAQYLETARFENKWKWGRPLEGDYHGWTLFLRDIGVEQLKSLRSN